MYDRWFQSLKLIGEDPLATGPGWNDWQGTSYMYDEYEHTCFYPTAWVGRQAGNFLEHLRRNKTFLLQDVIISSATEPVLLTPPPTTYVSGT
jgi:hypothetical protein